MILWKIGKTIRKFEATEEFIEEHIPFIISCISKFTGRYVSIENDDEYSIGMIAFVEAIEKYKEKKEIFMLFLD